jgi:hypothetical protein
MEDVLKLALAKEWLTLAQTQGLVTDSTIRSSTEIDLRVKGMGNLLTLSAVELPWFIRGLVVGYRIEK